MISSLCSASDENHRVIELFCESGVKETPWLTAGKKLMQMAKPFFARLANRDNQFMFLVSI